MCWRAGLLTDRGRPVRCRDDAARPARPSKRRVRDLIRGAANRCSSAAIIRSRIRFSARSAARPRLTDPALRRSRRPLRQLRRRSLLARVSVCPRDGGEARRAGSCRWVFARSRPHQRSQAAKFGVEMLGADRWREALPLITALPRAASTSRLISTCSSRCLRRGCRTPSPADSPCARCSSYSRRSSATGRRRRRRVQPAQRHPRSDRASRGEVRERACRRDEVGVARSA